MPNPSPSRRWPIGLALLCLVCSGSVPAESLKPGERRVVSLIAREGWTISPAGPVEAVASYRLEAAFVGAIRPSARVLVELRGPGGLKLGKTLHEGDPDLYLGVRPEQGGAVSVTLTLEAGGGPIPVTIRWDRQAIASEDLIGFEAEPNDSWQRANPMVLGRAVYGTADDVDYLENAEEGRSGLDWFRFEVAGDDPVLAYFQLELLDRDVSANLRVHRLDPLTGRVAPHTEGKDPMEVVHDRERERYSTHLSRTLAPGTYFVEVNANHPDYILRTKTYLVPPTARAEQAVEAGLDYLLNVGDAWFAQVPREGNSFVRSSNLHDTATRCTACHASSFSTEAALVGQANGYPIRSKSSMRYLVDRLENSITPLYGPDGLMWQRFIAIPLQSQGKQGGIVLDFQEQVEGPVSTSFERFGPFLRAAWRGRRAFPMDEANGVVPLDSKFGLAWRDWRVLDAMTRRTRSVSYAQSADAIGDLLDDPATDAKVETLQDRIHRLYAWWIVDKDHFAGRIKEEAEALLARQNPDGGWFESDKKDGPSAVYATGQLAWTLLKLGYTRDDPRIARALAYLLGQQQPFGGWFQTTTHENFRTPMRETRYAVEALAQAYPRPGAPLKSWGNRDGGPARAVRTSSILATLDDLDNLWDVPEAGRGELVRSILPLLDHPEPLVRARACACLGRIGGSESVDDLIGQLGHPSKIVGRSAAWALRRLGNKGIGREAICRALDASDVVRRRNAVRIFAYQFHGMDGDPALFGRLIDRAADPDLWTRLQALRTLRQWFYRTGDLAWQRRVVDAYLARMAVPDAPVVRKALSEGMYILLDENLGGGVSLQKNLAALPERFRAGAMQGRESVEREVLLGPVLAALESGNPLQREALVRSFDGSFFKGRTYARRPEGALDVGNDREFGFLYDPPVDLLDRVFDRLLNEGSTPETRRQAFALASFFQVFQQTRRPTIRAALLGALRDADDRVAEAARLAVARDLDLTDADPSLIRLIRDALAGDLPTRRAIAEALARAPLLLERPEIFNDVQGLLRGEAGGLTLLPVLGDPRFADAEVMAALQRSWGAAGDPADRLRMLEVLLARGALVDRDDPPAEVLEILRNAVVDPSAGVRERTVGAIGALPRFRSGRASIQLLLTSLADDAPGIRRSGLKIAATRPSFWARPDARERLLALLVDGDAQVRELALRCVEQNALISGTPEVARRVKALILDPALKDRATSALAAQGFPPDSVQADVPLGRPRLLSLATFRSKVNPLFYRAGEDGYSCVRCHANHNVLRIAEADPSKGFDGEALMTNYNSALKVINLGDPESSLLLRKARSPQGQGGADPSSPTGLTHVGGPRWDGVEHPGYRALLAWIREASDRAKADDLGRPVMARADSHAPRYEPTLAVDGNPDTFWHTEFIGASPGYPHELVVDLGEVRRVDGLLYVPRQDASEGRVKDYEVRLSDDSKAWSPPLARGTWADDPSYRYVALPGKAARFVQLRGLSEVRDRPFMSAAEVVVDSSRDR